MMAITRREFLKAAAAAPALVEGGLLASSRTAHAAEKKGKTVNIGFLAALSGPDAGWGLPGLTGNQMFIDEVNAEGGLLVGDTRHPLKQYAFDDEAIGSKALQGARQLVLQHDVKFISAIGGNPADATHPFLT
ncbi:MAG: ABC transporter substrate-binding protein, partial [candidate division Zixibacteria bacterium]|nr:ABC transporter substrate-binding protein [candidate division Zixibacteria bacterium]